MNLVELVRNSSSLIDAALPFARDFSLTNFLISAGSIVSLWLAARSSSAILGEYAKRFWFGYVDRDAVRKKKDALIKATAALEAAHTKQAELRGLIERLKNGAAVNPYIAEASEMLIAAAKHFRTAGLSDKALYYEKMARRLHGQPGHDRKPDASRSA